MGSLIALDVGTKTIGVARADSEVRLATPLLTLRRKGVRSDVARLVTLGGEQDVEAWIVGLPIQLDDTEGRSARLARQVGEGLREATQLPVHYQDERFSTLEASERLTAAGVDTRKQKSRIDQAAAAVILQDWLDEGSAT